MAFGGQFVVTPALGEGEAVVDARMNFQFTARAGGGEQVFQFGDHVERRQIVKFGASDIQFAFRLSEGQVRALGGVADQVP